MTTTKRPPAKRPSDRKPKAGTPLKATIRGKTWTVHQDALDDFELLDDLNRAESGEGHVLPSLLRRLLGDQYGDALDVLRDPDTGRVPVAGGAEFINELFEALNAGNS